MAYVVTEPGSPLDRVLADPDVTTFLNDRFHPSWHIPSSASDSPSGGASAAGTVQFFTADGCPITLPLAVSTPAQFVAIGNLIMLAEQDGSANSAQGTLRCTTGPR